MPCTLSTHKNLEAEIERMRKKWQEAVEFNQQYPLGFVADLQERRSKENTALMKRIGEQSARISEQAKELKRARQEVSRLTNKLGQKC